MPDTVVGLFRTRSEADHALGKLKEAGFGADQVSISTPAVRRRGLYYEQEVESGRFLVSVAGPRLEEARALMRASGAMEAAPVEAPLVPPEAPIEDGRPRPESG